jgi:hypothetical protein
MNRLCLFNILLGVIVLAIFIVEEDVFFFFLAVLNFASGIFNLKEIDK